MPSARRLAALVLVALAAWLSAAAAEPARYRVDPAESEVTFRAVSRLQTANGRFGRFQGEVAADPREPASSRVRIEIDPASIDTANTKRDTHLRSQDFFWVERHPSVTFESLRVERVEATPRAGASGFAGRLTVVGRLTMRGVAREVAVPVEVEIADTTLVARGEFALNRKDYGITYDSFINPVEDAVRVAFRFRATRE